MMSNAGLALNREAHAELLTELKDIDTLCRAVGRELVSAQVIGSVLITYLSRDDKQLLRAKQWNQ